MTRSDKKLPVDEHLIAVGTDFTPGARIAVERATQLAHATASRLVFVHVVAGGALEMAREPQAPTPAAASESAAAAAAAEAEAREQLAADAATPGAQTEVRTGRPHEALALAAEQRGARLLVVGVHAPLAPGESFFLGSTAERVLRHGSTPVLLARNPVDAAYRRVLVPLDLGEMSARVVRLVARLLPEAEYDVVHFVSPNASTQAKSKAHRDEVLAGLTSLCSAAELDPTRTRVRVFVAEPRDGILGEIRSRRPDVVAMGTHARSGLARVLLGSVADYVIHAAQGLDVLAVPPER